MPKASNTTKAAAKPAGKRAAPAPRVVRSESAAAAKQNANPETAMFQVLQPFWLGGAVVKPAAPNGAPVFVEMTPAEAEQYQEAGVLGTEAGEVPDTHTSEQSGGQDATNANGAPDGA